jgi:hypothetical protein
MRRAFRGIPPAAIALLAIGGSGCASLLPGGYAEGVRVHVHNESWDAVEVTAYVDGETLELGRVYPDHYPFFDVDLPNGPDAAVVFVVARSPRDGELRTATVVAGPGSMLMLHLDRDPGQTRWWSR